ncbi:MAG: glycosyltransferase [Bacteroidaceae bacterium]|nr:glycosyltransferase [Bacteroidaceae bacterium]
MSLSPVALFVYNRADNMLKTLDCLVRNTLAADTDLYVFSDGGKDEKSWQQVNEVRQQLHDFKRRADNEKLLHSVTLVLRPENIYLERNITEGIAQVFETHDRIIVLEDDICTSPYYLQYMNQAFDLYADIPTVMHVAGFTNLDLDPNLNLKTQELKNSKTQELKNLKTQKLKNLKTQELTNSQTQNFYFTPHMSGWGWGTWRDRWQQYFVHYKTREEALQGMTPEDQLAIQYGGVFPCLKSLDKRPIPWDICWEIAIYKAGGLCLTPAHTLVRNIGLKNGTHFRSFDILQYYEFDREPLQTPLPLTRIEHPQKDPHIEALFAQAITDWGIRYTPLGKLARWFYKRILKR